METAIDIGFSFFDVLPDAPSLTVIDVGALPLDNVPETYAPLVKRGKAKVVGFEADAEGCRRFKDILGPPHQIFPYIIGDGTPGVFHKTTHPMTGSLYPPNTALVSRFSNLAHVMQPTGSEPVQTHRLDDVLDLDEIDFLKLDVQGGELDVLKGAARLAPTALAVQTEVEFVPLYVDQPLFADVDAHLRSIGFQFHTLLGAGMRSFMPLRPRPGGPDGFKQMLWADAVYVPDVFNLDALNDERLLKLSALLHDLYQSVDLALHVLKALEARGKPEPFQAYAKRLGLT